MITITNEDCMDLMARYPDKHFELAIVDPPYGIDWTKRINYTDKQKQHQKAMGYKLHKPKDWDKRPPSKKFYREIRRVGVNQIVFGANYLCHNLPISRGWIIWDKAQDNFTAIVNELAWTSFDVKIKTFRRVNGLDKGFMNVDGGGIHPTEKPVALYKWLLKNYAKPGDKILDTHLGSGSIAIACHDAGYDLTACEIDKDYYEAAMKRLEQHQMQLKLI